MLRLQSGILPEGNQHALFIILEVHHSSPSLIQGMTEVPQLTQKLSRQYPDAGLTSVIGIGADLWDRLFPEQRPSRLETFRARVDGPRVAPATAGDLLLHLRSERPDLLFILARQIMQRLGSQVTVIEEISGFRYLDSRDMTGFVDGTENPTGDDRAEVALVNDDSDFIAGSYIHLQRYVHDLTAWEKLPESAQEAHIGRSKPDDIELAGHAKPPTAHISRVVIEDDGEELEILRHSMPYGGTQEAGLMFIAYGSSPEPFNKMLDAMVIADTDGHYDHLLDYTQAVTGNSFFAPSLDFLEQNSASSPLN